MPITSVISPKNTLNISIANDIATLDINIKNDSGLEIKPDNGQYHLAVKINDTPDNLLKLSPTNGLYCDISALPLTEKLIADISSSNNSLNITSNGVETKVGKKIKIGVNISNNSNNTLKLAADGLFVDMPTYLSTQIGSIQNKVGIWIGNNTPTSFIPDVLYLW